MVRSHRRTVQAHVFLIREVVGVGDAGNAMILVRCLSRVTNIVDLDIQAPVCGVFINVLYAGPADLTVPVVL